METSYWKRSIACVGLVTLVATTACEAQTDVLETGVDGDVVARSLAILAPWIEEYPGLTIAVARGDSMVWSAAFGAADRDAATPPTPATSFNVYSVAKMLTGVAAARLAQDGHLDLDQPVGQILPGLPEHYDAVTSRQLVSHLGGVAHYESSRDWEQFGALDCQEPNDAIGHFIERPLVASPGQQLSYTTYGFVLLSAVIAERSPQGSYTQYMREAVFEPAGMTDTRLDGAGLPADAKAVPYRPAGRGFEAIPQLNASCKFGGGGYLSSALDLARFGRALYSGALLSPEWLEIAATPASLTNGEDTGYGFGSDTNTSDIGGRSVTWVRHSGGSPGGRGYVVVLLSEGVSVGMAGNLDGEGMRVAATQVAYLFAGLDVSN